MNPKKLCKTVKSLGILYNCKYKEVDKIIIVEGSCQRAGKQLFLYLAFEADFPSKLPKCYWKNHIQYPLMPHVLANGAICYTDTESAVLNKSEPEAIIRDCLKMSLAIIEQGLTGDTKAEFLEHFETYWSSLRTSYTVRGYPVPTCLSKIELEGNVRYIDVYQYNVLGKTINRFVEEKTVVPRRSISKKIKAIYVPLQHSEWLVRSRLGLKVDDKMFIDNILDNVSAENSRLLRLLSSYLTVKEDQLFLASFSTSKGRKGLIGVQLARDRVIPLFIKRIDKGYLLERGGGNLKLQNKKVLLVGCGAVGGYVAEQLVKTGLKQIGLVDSDMFSLDNLYRHEANVLENNKKYKVDVLKEKLLRHTPYLEVSTTHNTIEEAIRRREIIFNECDLIVVATGAPDTNFYLNRYIHDHHPGLPVLYAWVDPYGLGGHTLITNNGDKGGCYHCLYNEELHNEASFAAARQKFSKSISGCGGYFVPFSSLDASQTAVQTVRAAVDVLLGYETGNPIISWKGSDRDFRAAGFETSARYNFEVKELADNSMAYKKERCKICSTHRLTKIE